MMSTRVTASVLKAFSCSASSGLDESAETGTGPATNQVCIYFPAWEVLYDALSYPFNSTYCPCARAGRWLETKIKQTRKVFLKRFRNEWLLITVDFNECTDLSPQPGLNNL